MYSTRLAHLLLVVLSIVTFTQAAWFDFTLLQRSDGLVIRQDTNSSSAAAAGDEKPAASASASEAAPATSEEEKTTKAEDTTTDEPPAATTTDKPADPTTKDDPPAPTTTDNNGGAAPAPTTTNNAPTAKPSNGGGSQPSSTNGGGGGNANPTPTASGDGGKTTAAPSTTQKPFTTVITIISTNPENGQVSTALSSSTVTPTLAQATNNPENEGMSKETQNTIIGVCVGVGGAIVLAVIGLLIWRLRKRRQDQEDGEDLVNYGAGTSQFNSGGPEKLEPGGSVSGRSPFQSTLESYHAPAQSNTGTNF